MPIAVAEKTYKPHQVARVLNEEYGHKLTPSVIRKWDNLILGEDYHKDRKKNEARTFTKEDIFLFNIIAILRNMGYGVEDTRDMVADIIIRQGDKATIVELKHTVAKQMKGLEQFESLLDKKVRK